MIASALPMHAQEDSPPAPSIPPEVQQLIDQAEQNGQNPSAAPSSVPTGGLLDEQTIAQLRGDLDTAMNIERQRQMLGQSPGEGTDPSVAAAQEQLLQREYDENILPVLNNATQNCLIAELGFTRASDWARQVQLLGLGNGPGDSDTSGVDSGDSATPVNGPLYGELQNVQALLVQIVQNCDKEVYEACVRDDSDPNARYLGDFMRQLAFLDNNPVYEQRYFKCEYGWHGTFTIHEEMSGSSRSRQNGSNGSSTIFQWDTSGTRDFSIDLPNKKAGADGTAKGHSLTTQKIISTASNCTSTQTQTNEVTGGGSGDASLRKFSSQDGSLLIGFTGPNEPGSKMHTSNTTQTNCGSTPQIPGSDALISDAPYRGHITEMLGDPLIEHISGSRNMSFVINASGTPVLAQQTSGGSLVRIPANPGGPPVTADVTPWLDTSPGANVDPSNFPTIRVTVNWNLTFGQ
jgi:hypothetical protein